MNFDASNKWRFISVSFVGFPKSVKTEVNIFIDDLAPVKQTIQGHLVNDPAVIPNPCPVNTACQKADEIGMNFRGAIKQVRINSRFDCIYPNGFSGGISKPCLGGGSFAGTCTFCDPYQITTNGVVASNQCYSNCGLTSYNAACTNCDPNCDYCFGGSFTQCTACSSTTALHLRRDPGRAAGAFFCNC